MLKIWVHPTNLKSARLIYLIALTNYLILDFSRQNSNANQVDEGITSASVSLVDRTAQEEVSLSRIINQGIASKEELTAEQRCLLDLESSSNNGKQLPRRFAVIASPTNIPCELKFDNSSTLISSTDQIIVPFKPQVNPLLLVTPKPIDRSPISVTNTTSDPNPRKDPRYQIAPRPVNIKQLNPALTRTVVNDVPLTHRTQLEITGGVDSGDRTNTNIGLNATRLDNPTAQESVSSNRIYRTEYNSNYSQLRTVRQQRDITTTTISPQTIFGFRQQISFIGDCIVGVGPGTGAQQLCTYLPGLKTDESSIDPKTLIPRRFLTPSQFGDIVTPESRLAITAPGFQGGANGQFLGLDLYFPKVGTEASEGKNPNFDRFESITNVPAISIGQTNQVILANGRETAIARTVHGYNYVLNDRNSGWMAAIQTAASLLPNVEPFLPSGKKGGSVEVDRSLLLAANNNRIPENSLTSYYGGIGSGLTPTNRNASTSTYRGIWFGFSPVTDRQVSSSETLENISAERITQFAGGEGGVDSTANVTVVSNKESFDSTGITNAYVQTYLTRYERDAIVRNSNTIRERISYQPHISATGNVTTLDSVLRYYTGVILNLNPASSATNTHKAYVGVDYYKVEPQGFSYNLAAIAYANPDPDYYSKLTINATKQIPLGKNPAYSLEVSGNVNYVLDGAKVFDAVNFRSASSFLSLGARTNLNDFSLGTTYYMATTMPNSIGNLLSTNASWKVSPGLTLSGYYTPVNDNAARSPFGASANIRLGSSAASPTLSLSWNRNETDLGVNANNSRAGTSDNTFAAYLRFEAPSR
jgi:hypothetical protein